MSIREAALAVAISLVVVVSSVRAVPSYAQDQVLAEGLSQFNWFKERCPTWIANVAADFARFLEPSQRDTFQSIRVECLPDAGVGAYSLIEPSSGERVILVTAGTLMAIEPLATLSAAATARDSSKGCISEYLELYGDVFRHNNRVIESGDGNFRIFPSPYEFLATNGACPNLTRHEVMADHEIDRLRAFMIDGALKFILAHEFAHHVVSDVPESDPVVERACDRYAIEFLVSSSIGPFGAALPLALIGSVDGFSMTSKPSASHSPGGCRFAQLADAVEAVLADKRFVKVCESRAPGTRSMLKKELKRMRKQAKRAGCNR